MRASSSSSHPRDKTVVLAAACAALLVGAEALASGCSVPSLDETGKSCTGERCPSGLPCVNGRCGGAASDAGSDTALESGVDAAACLPPDGGDPCISIPRLNGVQMLDCAPTEFCDVPVWTLDAPSGGATPAAVSLQVAWSPIGLHVFVSVKKWPVLPETTTSLYIGDAVELFVAASSASLLGTTADDAIHAAVAPPALDSGLGGAAVFFEPNEGSMVYSAPSGLFVGCVIPDTGYDLEIQMPWNLPWLPQTSAPDAGSTIGFDFAIDVKPENAAQVQTFEFIGPALDSGAPNQCQIIGRPEAPYCDDRCSCRPIVQ